MKTYENESSGVRLRPIGVALLKDLSSEPAYVHSRGVQNIMHKFYSPDRALAEWRRIAKERKSKTSIIQQIEQGFVLLAHSKLRSLYAGGYLSAHDNGRRQFTITSKGLEALKLQPWKRNRWHKEIS